MTDQEKERTCPFCKTKLLRPLYMYRDFHCPYCGANIGEALDVAIKALKVDLWQLRQEATENALKKAEVLYKRPPMDAEKIVFCKDCRHRDPEDKKCDCGCLERQGCFFPVADDYFCKFGARRYSEKREVKKND